MKKVVTVKRRALEANEERAQALRNRFVELETLVVNLISSPGSGKTTLLEATVRGLEGELKLCGARGRCCHRERRRPHSCPGRPRAPDPDRRGVPPRRPPGGRAVSRRESARRGHPVYRKRRQSDLPDHLRSRRRLQSGGVVGGGGRRQARQIPGDLFAGRGRGDLEIRSPAVRAVRSRFRPLRRSPASTPTGRSS